MKRRALFLDRDGVINIDYAYVHKIESFHFVNGIFELVARANALGYLVVVVTNQAGIGRGYYTEDDFAALTGWMKDQFVKNSARIDAVLYCPDHPEHGIGHYKTDSPMRKPGPGMLLKADAQYGIDLPNSIMIGDKLTDMQAGKAAGVGTLLWLHPETADEAGTPIYSLQDALHYLTGHAEPISGLSSGAQL